MEKRSSSLLLETYHSDEENDEKQNEDQKEASPKSKLKALVNYYGDEGEEEEGEEEENFEDNIEDNNQGLEETQMEIKPNIENEINNEQNNLINRDFEKQLEEQFVPSESGNESRNENEIENEKIEKVEEMTVEEEQQKLEVEWLPEISEYQLPSEPTGEYSIELQERIRESLRRSGSLNDKLIKLKSFRNPNIYSKLLEIFHLEEYGTNYPPEVFSFSSFPQTAFYDQLSIAQTKMMDALDRRPRFDPTNPTSNQIAFLSSRSTEKNQDQGNQQNRKVLGLEINQDSTKTSNQVQVESGKKKRSKWDVESTEDVSKKQKKL